MTAEDIREMSFQNVLDTILKPAGVHVGGYPEDLFTDLEETERDKWNCSICFLVVREARECANKHLFCHTCVFAWSLTYGENSQKCPMCRVAQRTYLPNKEVNKLINDKRVKCPEDDCTFRSPLRIFLMHSHGRQRYANDEVDLESLRPVRSEHAHNLIILPGGVAFTGNLQGALAGGAQRAANIREQLQQGRAMIHQMMMLLHLEMQLRQQALVSYSQAQDPDTRLRRLDEVLSLNEQLNEVGTILSALLSTPLATRGGRAQPTPPVGPRRVDVSRDVMLSRGVGSQMPSMDVIMSRGGSRASANPHTNDDDDVDDDDDDDEEATSDSDATSVSSVISVAPRVRMSLTGQLHSPRGGPLAASLEAHRSELGRPQRRDEIRAQLLSLGNTSEASSSVERVTPRLLRRETTNAQSRNHTSSSSTAAQDQANNNGVAVSIQRLDSNSSSNQQDNSPSVRDQGTTLPPLPRTSNTTSRQAISNTNTRGPISPRGAQASRLPQQPPESSNNSQGSPPGSLLPTGSSTHQRILRSLNGGDADTTESGDEADGEATLTSQRANSVARRPLISVAELLRGPRVTSEGVTASGAVYSTSADTPSTRAASRRTAPVVPLEGVTLSGATYSTLVDTPLTRAVSGVGNSATRRRSEATDSVVSNDTATQQDPSEHPESVSSSSTAANAGTDSPAMARTPISRYAPQRRFRRNTSMVEQSSTGMTPYVPHRSSSPGRFAPQSRTRRSQSLSVEDRRRLNFSRGDDEGESVIRRAARSTNRASLPTTAGQLLRARRNSQGQNRRLGNNRNDPNGTV